MHQQIQIRPISPGDNAILAQLIRAVFDEHQAAREGTVYSDPRTDYLYQEFQQKGAAGFTAQLGAEIVGCCGIYPTEGLDAGQVELVKFYLSPAARGRGIGLALMQRCFTAARKRGYTQMYIESLAQFGKAVRMYQKLGFKTLPRALGNSGHSSCNIWMLKDL